MKATGKILAIYVNDEILGLIDGYAKQEQKSGRSVIIRQTVLDFFWRGASDGHCFY
jgi:hypothetical protein